MLDVHVIISPKTPVTWVDRCLYSLIDACVSLPYAVEVHLAPYIDGHIGHARQHGYAMGSHPYVTTVDDDDWLEPNAFSVLRDSLQSGAPAVYTRETVWQNGKPRLFDNRQNLRIYRRDVLNGFDFGAWPILSDEALSRHADGFGPGIDLPDRVYNYRINPSGSRKLYPQHADLVRKLHG
jgi:glycosyltransferase involved in cell wall biosynthesis